MSVEGVLENIGFEPHEITIYLYLLSAGCVSQQTISDQTGLLRQTVYEVMRKMEIKGYLSVTQTGKRKQYGAINPRILLDKVREQENELLEALPSLEKMMSREKVKNDVETFTGLDGLKSLFAITLESPSEILWIANKAIYENLFQGYYWHNYAKKRIEKKIPIKLLIEPTKETDWNTDKKALRETRISSLVDGIKSSFVIFGDKVIIYSIEQEQLFGVLIHSSIVKKDFEKMFYQFWNTGQP